MGIRITGTVSNDYTYGTGINAGVPFSYTANFNEVFLYSSTPGACSFSRSPSFRVTVPYRERVGTVDVDRDISIGANSVNWDRERGFFGIQTDTGNDPINSISSGIELFVGGGFPIRGTFNSGYNFSLRVCRSDSPPLPIVARPDTFRLSQPPIDDIDSGTRPATTPDLICLNRVISEYDETFDFGSGSDTNSIRIQYRFYAVVRRVAPCLIV
jgi:hypothetical protein